MTERQKVIREMKLSSLMYQWLVLYLSLKYISSKSKYFHYHYLIKYPLTSSNPIKTSSSHLPPKKMIYTLYMCIILKCHAHVYTYYDASYMHSCIILISSVTINYHNIAIPTSWRLPFICFGISCVDALVYSSQAREYVMNACSMRQHVLLRISCLFN